MTQISLVSGIYSDKQADYRISYPKNFYPVVQDTGLSNAYLRQTPGLSSFATGEGFDRGSIVFFNILYRVSGTQLIRVFENGVTQVLGTIPGNSRVTMNSSFDRIGIVADNKAFYWSEGNGLQHITDPDFCSAIDGIFIDGYFLYVDAESIFNADLNDPMAINPISFGSAEVDSDPIIGIARVGNEAYVCGSETIQILQNVGGAGFPFATNPSAFVTRGIVGTHAKTEVDKVLYFVGAGRGDAASVYASSGGSIDEIATPEIAKLVQSYNSMELKQVYCESYNLDNQYFVLIHLPDYTIAYDIYGSQKGGVRLWHIRDTRGRGLQRAYGKWLVGDKATNAIGQLNEDDATEYGEIVEREFSTPLGFVDGFSFIVHEAIIYGLPGRTGLTDNPSLSMEVSRNGVTWSQPRSSSTGKTGTYDYTCRWFRLGRANTQMSMRFKLASNTFYSAARLEVREEPLSD